MVDCVEKRALDTSDTVTCNIRSSPQLRVLRLWLFKAKWPLPLISKILRFQLDAVFFPHQRQHGHLPTPAAASGLVQFSWWIEAVVNYAV